MTVSRDSKRIDSALESIRHSTEIIRNAPVLPNRRQKQAPQTSSDGQRLEQVVADIRNVVSRSA